MGQTTSSLRALPSTQVQGRSDAGLGWLDFLGMWIGSAHHHQGQDRLPTSWEELLAWTEALNIWQMLSLSPNDNNIHKADHFRIFPCVGPGRKQEATTITLEFHAMVDANVTDQVARLPCFSWIDLAIFYHKHVRVEARRIDTNPTPKNGALIEPPLILTVVELGRLYMLGRHVMELTATLQHSTILTGTDNIHLCAICCTEHENTQLPCGHGLCETCEVRWVARKLTCPFCRARFKKGARHGWNITEFDPQHLETDIQTTRDRIREIWNRILQRQDGDYLLTNNETNRTFVAVPAELLETTQTPQDFALINEA